jgi:hypothetical protein
MFTEDYDNEIVISSEVFTENDRNDQIARTEAKLSDDSDLPEWLVYNAENKTFSGVPTNEAVGAYSVKLSAFDTYGAEAQTRFDLYVLNTNDKPLVAEQIQNQEIDQNSYYEFTIPQSAFIDVDAGDVLNIELEADMPSWMHYNSENQTIYGLATEAGEMQINVFAKDLAGEIAVQTFTLTVKSMSNVQPISALEPNVYPSISTALFSAQSFEVIEKISVTDMNGKLLLQTNPNKTETNFDLSNYAGGTYFVEIQSKNSKTTHRVILKK